MTTAMEPRDRAGGPGGFNGTEGVVKSGFRLMLNTGGITGGRGIVHDRLVKLWTVTNKYC